MKSSNLLLFIVLLVILCAGCLPEENAETHQPQVQPWNLIIGLDGTTSYKPLERAKATAFKYIKQAPAGSRIVVRWITSNSYSDETVILAGTLPTFETKTANPFSVQDKQRSHSQKLKHAKILFEFSKALENTPSPKSRRTDINGFFTRANKRLLSIDRTKYSPRIILMSDLQHNTHHRLPKDMDFSNTEITIADFQENCPTRIENLWRERFERWGAAKVRFKRLDED